MSDTKLPPIENESFDGDKQKTDIKFDHCIHKDVKFVNGEIRCMCGNAWGGPGLHELYKLLKNQ